MKVGIKRLLMKYTYILVVISLAIPPTFTNAMELKPSEKDITNVDYNVECKMIEPLYKSNSLIGEMERKRLAKIEEDKRIEIERLKQIELKKIQDNYDKECYFDINDISKPSNISIERAYKLLEGTTYQTWEMAQAFVDGEKLSTPVNAIFSISVTRHESFHGKSELARDRNNITSWKNRDGSWRYFDSKLECIEDTNSMFSREYLNSKGLFFNGKSLDGIGKDYCEGNTWSGYISDMMYYITQKY